MTSPALFTSRSSEWTTPTNLFEALNKVFHFTLDPCASKTNAKCRRYFTKLEDGLTKKWSGRVFMNPPYGRQIGKWVKKAHVESQTNAEIVVCLLPSRTDTIWFHDYCAKGEILFFKGRLHFSEAESPAPFPSMLVCFRKSVRSFEQLTLRQSSLLVLR
ncbi:MAG TPA: DNA N-6-adenine-methyltransferase [Pyrinomonadaceae bacterium]